MSATSLIQPTGVIAPSPLVPPSDAFYLFVEGIPEPSGSPKIINFGGRPAIRWQKGPKWTNQVRAALNGVLPDAPRPFIPGPVQVVLRFWMPSPAKSKYPVPATPPDLDKLVRSTWDGFVDRVVDDESGSKQKRQVPLLIQDDARFIKLMAEEHYAHGRPTGVDVWVWSLQL